MTTTAYARAPWLLLMALLLLMGCSTPTTSSDYLGDYDRLARGKFLEKYFADPDAIGEAYSRIELGSISTDRIDDREGVSVSQCQAWLREVISRGPGLTSSREGRVARLDVAITEMDPGSAAARIWAGELGAGHAWVQLEGTITDPESGATLATFAERRRDSGAIGLKDMGGDAGPSLVRGMIEDIGQDIVRELQVSFGFNGS